MSKTTSVITSAVFTIIFSIIQWLSGIWVMVSFCLYLFKDIPFDWTSVISFALSFILMYVFIFIFALIND